MDTNDYKICYDILHSVFVNKAYVNIAIDKALKNSLDCDSKAITFLCYGVVQHDNNLRDIISKLVDKTPKQSVMTILKIGVYSICYMNIPDNACVNSVVSMTKAIGKSGVAGFVNAILRRVVIQKDELLASTTTTTPQWIIDMLMADLGTQVADCIINYKHKHLTHIRANLFKVEQDKFDSMIAMQSSAKTTKTSLGYLVDGSVLRAIDSTLYTAQSLGSMLVVECIGRDQRLDILDLCAAPGGKSIYAMQNNPLSTITSCDIYEHRVALISKYIRRMGATNITTCVNDATVICDRWIDSFDIVMCDVPCSGLGVMHNKPDMLLNLTQDSIADLARIQGKILSTAARYAKHGGKILYSTCTYSKRENQDVIYEFLHKNSEYKILPISTELVSSDDNGFVNIMPHMHDSDGFFACMLVRQ